MLALVVCEEGGRGLATPQSSKWGDYKRESQPEKAQRGRGGMFPMHRPSMDVPGKSLLDVIVQKGIKSHFPGSIEDWEQWGESPGLETWSIRDPLSTHFVCPNSPHPRAAYVKGCSRKTGRLAAGQDFRIQGIQVSLSLSESPQFFSRSSRESRSSLTTLLALFF